MRARANDQPAVHRPPQPREGGAGPSTEDGARGPGIERVAEFVPGEPMVADEPEQAPGYGLGHHEPRQRGALGERARRGPAWLGAQYVRESLRPGPRA